MTAVHESLAHRIRPAAGEPEGALVLIHGRGADEHDLFPLIDLLDPEARLVGVTPRAPLRLPPGGAHWYVVGEIGRPDPETFRAAYAQASDWLDAMSELTGVPPERTILGGFSQGSVMSWALGLGRGRPSPAGIIGLSGFIPTVDSFELDLGGREGFRAAIGHGTYDPVIDVMWGRQARDLLLEAGAAVLYRESPMGHAIDPGFLTELAAGWVREAVA
jgi:phospholipase/carboxylesterase